MRGRRSECECESVCEGDEVSERVRGRESGSVCEGDEVSASE